MFAKLFNSRTYGQILIQKGRDSGQPAIETIINIDDVGLCDIKLCFNPDDQGKKAFNKIFNEIDLVEAEDTARDIFNAFNKSGAFHERN